MASRYWVTGGTGNWSSTTNWSATTGGSSGASVPTSADDAFINANSGTSPVITVDVASNCLSLDFTGAITPTFAGVSQLAIAGSLTRIASMTWTYTGQVNFTATSSGKTITSAGGSFAGSFVFTGSGGVWTLQDALNVSPSISITGGTFNTNNFNISCGSFSSISGTRTINLGSSTINASDNVSFASSGLTLNAGTSTIIMSSIVTKTLTGGGVTFNNVTLTGATTNITGSNTFNVLTFTAGKTVRLTSGTTQTYTTLVAYGTPSSPITIQSVTAGSAATISKASGIQIIRNVSLKDITATGGATFYALGTVNVSGNTGWAYQMIIKQEKISGVAMALYHIDSNGVLQKVSG